MDDTSKIVETLILGPGMSVSRFESGEVVFTIEDEEGYRVACNASTFDGGVAVGIAKLLKLLTTAAGVLMLALKNRSKEKE